jgi:hypothetical protein
LKEAALAAGRDPSDVTLVAVSKRHPASSIRTAYEAGQRDFGENYVQELVAKAEELADLPDIVWHHIGHLQSNKARFVANLVDYVHTVSSVKLVKELARRVGQRGRTVAASPGAARLRGLASVGDSPPTSHLPLSVLVEVKLSDEESKSGCSPDELGAILDAIDEAPLLVAKGLMTMPPAGEPEQARLYFRRLRELREEHGGVARLPALSMGMSADAEVAVAEGATFVRIGTAIFGQRPTSKA